MISHAMSWEGCLEKSLVQKERRERKKFGNRNVIVIYIIVILTILTTSILSFSLRKNVTKIYNPEIPEA